MNDDPEEQDTFLMDPQKGLANAAGITADVYMAAFKDWRDIKDLLDDAVLFKNEFEATQRDKSSKKLSPASGESPSNETTPHLFEPTIISYRLQQLGHAFRGQVACWMNAQVARWMNTQAKQNLVQD